MEKVDEIKKRLEEIDCEIKKLIDEKYAVCKELAKIVNETVVPVIKEKLGYEAIATVVGEPEDPTWLDVELHVCYPALDQAKGTEEWIKIWEKAWFKVNGFLESNFKRISDMIRLSIDDTIAFKYYTKKWLKEVDSDG